MRQWQNSDIKKYFIAFLIIWVVQMAVAFYFCTQKQGFHEDEYYTYYSTARTNGFYVEDGKWMEQEEYRNEFVVLPEGRFQYGLVKQVQSWDVHPPVYYWVFHTIASLVPNVFSKWVGLSINLLIHGINIILLTLLSYLAVGRSGKLPLFITLFWGLCPAVMSGVVFIRMYEMLTMFVLLCGILHVHAVKRNETKLPVRGCLVPMAVVTYLGFLTQYYYFIFLFYLAIAFGVWLLWRDRNIRNCLRYGISQGIAFVLAYLTYPSCLGQMFRGQRGAQATGNFFNWSNTAERIGFFYDLMNRYVFGHLLTVLLLLVPVLAGVVYLRSRRFVKNETKQTDDADDGQRAERFGISFWMLVFAAVGYFLTVSKTALLLGGDSNRYQLPIYGIVVLLVFAAIERLWQIMAVHIKQRKYAELILAVILLGAVLLGYRRDGMVFLYPEACEQTAFAKECAAQDIPVVYLYRTSEEWCVWGVTDELFAYPEVYFAAVAHDDILEDERIQNADALIVYLAKGADKDEQIGRILDSNRSLTDYRLVFEEKYCDVYYLYGIL